MSFWEEIFGKPSPKPPEKKIVEVNVNEKNVVWLLNEELKRMHALLINPVINDAKGSNRQTFWKKIEDLQTKMSELIDKSPDVDVQKQLIDIQSHIIDETILTEKK